MNYVLGRCSCLLICLLSASGLGAQDWSYYGMDPGGSRFSPLTQIDAANVTNLQVAWSHRYGDLEDYPERSYLAGYHVTPILLPESAGRSLVACTPFHRMFALDPATGEERWSFDSQVSFGPFKTRLKCLGVAYWEDSEAAPDAACKHRVFMGTSDRRIVAHDARTGLP